MTNIPKVQYPTARHDMILYLKDLSDFEMQKRDWVDPNYEHPFWDNMRFPIETLLDEWDLDDKARSNISYILIDAKEADMVEKPSKLLKHIIDEVGIEKPDQVYLTSPLWQEVVVSAKEAYDYIMSYEDMDALLLQCKAESQK